mgnify:CR=1 FL=1
MALLVLLPLAAAVGILTGGRRAPVRWLALAAPAVLALVVVGLVARAGPARDGAGVAEATTWVPSLDLSLSFRLDGFALLMGLVVAGVGTLVLAYSVAYFAHDEDPERVRRFTAWFLAFAGSMLGLVLADDGWTLFLFWEATSITSFVLIGLDDRSPAARASAQRALLVTAAGGLCLLGGLVLVTQAAGASTFAALAADPPTGAAVSAGLVLVLVGAATKSAQVPFHFWLPGAMAAPTPVSAFLHSATMVKAGVILVARLAPVFAGVTWWRPAVVVVGTATMLVGGVGALRQHDAKLLLAHGTVSQLGLLVVLFGLGHPGVTAAAVAVLVAATLIALAAACGPPEPPKDAYGLRTVLGDGEIVLEWSAPPGAAGATYEVQYGVGAGWLPLTTTTDTTATFSDVQERSTYWFRVRTAAQAGKSAGSWSPAVTAYYVEPVLPIVRIDTNGAAPILDRDNYVPGTISIDPNGSGYAAYSGTMGIRGRGNSTWAYPKKPYRVKLDTKSPIMGIAAERDWVLGELDLYMLDEPPYDPGCWEEFTALVDEPEAAERACAYPTSTAVVALGSRFKDEAPAGVRRFLDAYHGSSAMLSRALAYMHAHDAGPEEAARHLLATERETWSAWLEPETAARVAAAFGAH